MKPRRSVPTPAKAMFRRMQEAGSVLAAAVRLVQRERKVAARVLPDPTYVRRPSRITASELLTGKKERWKSKQAYAWGVKVPKSSRPVSKNEERMLAHMRASTQIGGSHKTPKPRGVSAPSRTVTPNQVARAKLSHLSNSKIDSVMKKSNAAREQYYR